MGNEFSEVDPGAVDTLTFNYSLQLGVGETLVTPTLSVTTIQSTDAGAAARFGAPAVNGQVVTCVFTNLVADVNYDLRMLVTTSLSRTLVCQAVLPCRQN